MIKILKCTRMPFFIRKFPTVKSLTKDLQVMDLTAITLCKENNIPIAVFNIRVRDNLRKAVLGETIGTIVRR